jgi:hypothetical protein
LLQQGSVKNESKPPKKPTLRDLAGLSGALGADQPPTKYVVNPVEILWKG